MLLFAITQLLELNLHSYYSCPKVSNFLDKEHRQFHHYIFVKSIKLFLDLSHSQNLFYTYLLAKTKPFHNFEPQIHKQN